ncbi:MAG TPA: class I SAM-dependent methyltransferase [Noviherbaspirillum sp.]|uniref:class I SAM-dependent methyltransferase n=1 Tax=Noviherbaspirillum sp. TaxID=1926288 RepID=UPI002B46C01D|nr:class I SAM-dependent methyltransferase [Noviherbaspirillum sp.]HJV84301.1 class I SAM-dependent methyltransferase [Noviherbaspirillum sp.]
MTDLFYKAYEDRHRGSRELIKSRLRAYLPFLKPLATARGPATAFDLGCGRGEWLELLGEAGFDATGVDLDEGMLSECGKRGLDARRGDALTTLRALPDNCKTLVSAFHVVEHMPFDDMRTLVEESLRVLAPGGLLILETPNSENLMVGAYEFYKDPSHTRPVPWELLQFVVEHAGFQRNAVLRLQERPELRNGANIRLINVLGGVSPDYAVVAQKNADGELLSLLDQAFSFHYGLSLESLAQRYDAQFDKRLAAIEAVAAQSETRAAQAAQQAQDRINQLEQRLAQLDAQLHAQLDAVYRSNSWRVTAPLRALGSQASRIRAAMRGNALAVAARRGVKSVLRKFGHAVQRNPTLRQAALGLLNRMPGLKRRLHGIIYAAGDASAVMPTQREPEYLPPRAMGIYTELKKMMGRETS